MLWRNLGVAALCLCASAAVSADFQVYNPYPEELSGVFALDAGGLDAVRLVGEGGAALPSQVVERDGRKLIVSGATIPAFGSVGMGMAGAKTPAAASLMKVTAGGKGLIVETPLYKLVFDAKKGYSLSSIEDKGRWSRPVRGCVEIVEDGEQAKHNGNYAKDQKVWSQGDADVKLEVAYAGAVEAEVVLTWPLLAGNAVTERICFNAFNRLVRHEVEVDCKDMVIAQGRYALLFSGFSSPAGEGTVYPQEERCPARTFPCPGYEFAWNPRGKCGVGLVAPQGHGLLDFTWEMKGAKEGISGDNNKMYVFSKAMRYESVPGKYRFGFSLVAGGDPAEAERYQHAANSPREFVAVPAGGLVAKALRMELPSLEGRDNAISLDLCPGQGGLRVSADAKEVYAGPAVSPLTWRPEVPGLNTVTLKRGGVENVYYVPVSGAVTVDSVWPGKIIYKFDRDASASVKLSNHSQKPERVKLVSSALSGLDERKVVDERTLDLRPGAKEEVSIAWKSGHREYGFTLLVEAFVDGKLVGSGKEYFAVGDSNAKLAQYGVANPGWMKTPGISSEYINALRKNYFGAFEYYVWTPCPYLGLTPEGDSWEPETESQVSYSARIEKKFVIDFVKLAHENGIAVFPWMNGEVALGTGLDHPEYYRYGRNGQPLFYNGTIRNGKRYAIAYSSVLYDEKASYEFGKMMSASIDMFGWDGCRFDWGFTPSVVGDPMRAKESEWFNSEGRSSRELFPDPDSSGVLFLKAFKRGVAEKHPEFVYGTNADFSQVRVEARPKYAEEISKNSLLWYEYLLGYKQTQFGTWSKWIDNLVADIGRSKGNGAQVVVGDMIMYPHGALSHRAMPFALLFSGAHWVGPWDRNSSLGESWRCWRHALRFSEFYFNRDFVALDAARVAKEISLEGADKVMWRNWVSERKREGGRDVLVNLLNIDGSKHISERTLPREPKRNLKVSLKLKEGEAVKEAFLLLSEPEPHAQRLPLAGDEVVIPELDLAASLVVVIAEKK